VRQRALQEVAVLESATEEFLDGFEGIGVAHARLLSKIFCAPLAILDRRTGGSIEKA
jgi:hypothetical protein